MKQNSHICLIYVFLFKAAIFFNRIDTFYAKNHIKKMLIFVFFYFVHVLPYTLK